MRHFDRADLLHALFACFLFFKEFFLARHIATVALGQHVLAQRFDCLTFNDVCPDGGLDRRVLHLAADDFTHLGHHRPAAELALAAVDDDG